MGQSVALRQQRHKPLDGRQQVNSGPLRTVLLWLRWGRGGFVGEAPKQAALARASALDPTAAAKRSVLPPPRQPAGLWPPPLSAAHGIALPGVKLGLPPSFRSVTSGKLLNFSDPQFICKNTTSAQQSLPQRRVLRTNAWVCEYRKVPELGKHHCVSAVIPVPVPVPVPVPATAGPWAASSSCGVLTGFSLMEAQAPLPLAPSPTHCTPRSPLCPLPFLLSSHSPSSVPL